MVYKALHQCYSSGPVWDIDNTHSESYWGDIIVNRLLKGGKGHYSPLECPSIVFNIVGYPHSAIQQLTRHRLVSFAVQSFRYTGDHIQDVVKGSRHIEDVVYLRPVGNYTSRNGKTFYTSAIRNSQLKLAADAASLYNRMINEDIPYEMARGSFPFDYRQHVVMTCNARSLMHLLDMRLKPNAQLEIRHLSSKLLDAFVDWMPEVAQWYIENRQGKGRLAP